MAQIYVVMYVTEPGEDNWLESSFRWEYDSLVIPGWELTESWMTADDMPQCGFLYCNYYSGEGKNIKGCASDEPLRKALLHLVSTE